MVIEWFGGGRVRLSGEAGRVWMDAWPASEEIPTDVDAHIVTFTDGPHATESIDRTAPARHVSADGAFVVRGPGEYEVHGIFVTAVTAYGGDELPTQQGHLAVNVLLDDVAVCHLGRWGALPRKDQVEMLGDIDVLLVPVGGGTAPEPANIADVVATLEPSVVVPMYFDPADPADVARLDRFLTELGLEPMEPLPQLQAAYARLPDELQAAVLSPSD